MTNPHMIKVAKEDLEMLFDERACCPGHAFDQQQPMPGMFDEGSYGFMQEPAVEPGFHMPDSFDDGRQFPGMMPMAQMGPAGPCGCPTKPFCPPGPIIEPPIERCVRREFCHDVQHL